jgi:choline monooxygenase
MSSMYRIDPRIERASTLPGRFYSDENVFAQLRDKVFPASWQFVGDLDKIPRSGSQYPFAFVPGMIEEPLLLVRENENTVRCLSNTCTHRANMLVETACEASLIKCRYHGRQFLLNGNLHHMPGFEGAENFPSETDHLRQVAIHPFHRFVFCSLNHPLATDEMFAAVEALTHFMPYDALQERSELARDFFIRANWALYVDNYLEGLHIPYVHRGLNRILDFQAYETRLLPQASLQVGFARDGEQALDLPATSPDAGKRIAAYYLWLFPNTMLNTYPWGISVNVVKPQSVSSTVVSFRIYVWSETLFETSKMDLTTVEMEDEAVVERAQVGAQSRFYTSGRYAPQWEKGVHHFHRLLCDQLS